MAGGSAAGRRTSDGEFKEEDDEDEGGGGGAAALARLSSGDELAALSCASENFLRSAAPVLTRLSGAGGAGAAVVGRDPLERDEGTGRRKGTGAAVPGAAGEEEGAGATDKSTLKREIVG